MERGKEGQPEEPAGDRLTGKTRDSGHCKTSRLRRRWRTKKPRPCRRWRASSAGPSSPSRYRLPLGGQRRSSRSTAYWGFTAPPSGRWHPGGRWRSNQLLALRG